jgi:hypothetical protein
MTISIEMAIEKGILGNCEIFAGGDGIKKSIEKVGILDYESPDEILEYFKYGELVLSSLLVLSDGKYSFDDYLKKLIEVGTSAILIKKMSKDYLKPEHKKIADEHDFPIIVFEGVFFEDIILEIENMNKMDEDQALLEFKIDQMISSDLSKVIIKGLVNEINPNFQDVLAVVYLKRKDGSEPHSRLVDFNQVEKHDELIRYHGGYLYVITFKERCGKLLKELARIRLNLIGIDISKWNIATSRIHDSKLEIDLAIQEAIYTHRHIDAYGKCFESYEGIGTDRIYLPILENKWVQDYYENMIFAIENYDMKQNTELLKTAEWYVHYHGSIKAVANELDQHDNTIRYRINKIGELIKCDHQEDLYEQLIATIRIHKLMKKR